MKKDGSGCEDLERNPPYVEQNGCKKLPYNCEQCRRDKTKFWGKRPGVKKWI